MTKTDRLLNWLKAGHFITGKQCLKRFGIYRLSEFIRRFRKHKNLDIITEKIRTKQGDQYAKYYLNKR